jgi:hypothetical protein
MSILMNVIGVAPPASSAIGIDSIVEAPPLDAFDPMSPVSSKRTRSRRGPTTQPLEDLFPFLDRDEFRANMIIEPLPE